MAKSLVIVESPAKARTLKRYLGKDYEVMASVGHIRDLPTSKLGVDLARDFAPEYVTIKGKGKIVKDLQAAAGKADTVFLAPDPDREGEAIAWHLAHYLGKSDRKLKRALFHELTKKAILEAIDKAGELNPHRFDAQQARRVLDRLVGYQVSPLLWDKVRRGLSAGRVQSVALRMICDREREIEAFVSEEYWTLDVELAADVPPAFTARLQKVKGKKAQLASREATEAVLAGLEGADYQVRAVEKKQRLRRPLPPFITSTLQQDAVRKLKLSAKRTMALAQKLYEGIDIGAAGPTGLITYMRTDSTRVNADAVAAARDFIAGAYGPEWLPEKAVFYKSASSAQDAHEAIRPTDVTLTPDALKTHLDRTSLALYSLIWQRFVASQMRPAVFDQTTAEIGAGTCLFKATGSVLVFAGFLRVYNIVLDSAPSNAPDADNADRQLPPLATGDRLATLKLLPEQHFTQPPPRYNEASLVKALEENGVGRPSTYAAIISTLQDKEYARLEQRVFFPSELGKVVSELLVAHFPDLFNVEFTAGMEKKLDLVEQGDVAWLQVMRDFYGPFAATLDLAKDKMKSVKRQAIPTDIRCPACGGVMNIKWGKMGEFLACEKYPQCSQTADFTRSPDGAIAIKSREEPEASDESCDKCGRPMVYKKGRFGRFLACSGYPDCKNVRSETTGVSCPEPGCDGELVKKVSRRGKTFYSCNRYPACTHAVWDRPVPQPCPRCAKPFVLAKESKKAGTFLQCPDKECGWREDGDAPPTIKKTAETKERPAVRKKTAGAKTKTGTKPASATEKKTTQPKVVVRRKKTA